MLSSLPPPALSKIAGYNGFLALVNKLSSRRIAIKKLLLESPRKIEVVFKLILVTSARRMALSCIDSYIYSSFGKYQYRGELTLAAWSAGCA